MAYLLDDEQQKQQQGQQPQGAEQVVGGGGAGLITPGDSSTGLTQQAQGPAPKAGGNIGGFTNLQSYVTANQGNDKAIGDKVSGVVGGDATASDAAVSNYQGAGSAAVDKGTVKLDTGLQSAVGSDPNSVLGDPSKLSDWKKQLAGQYAGPKSASEVQGFGDAQKANQVVKEDLSAAGGGNIGRQSLLDKAYGRANYTSGEKGLDSFLLGAGEDGQKSLADIQNNYGKSAGAFDDATSGLNRSVSDAGATSAATGAAQRGFLDSTGGASEAGIKQAQSKLSDDNTAGDAQFGQIQSYLGSRDQATRLKGYQMAGLDPDAMEFYRGSNGDMSSVLQHGTAKGLGDVLDPSQVAKFNGLKSLGYAGGNYDFGKTGGNGQAYTTNADRVSGINKMSGLYSGLDAKAAAANQQRSHDAEDLLGGLNSMSTRDQDASLAKLGISRADFEALGGDVTPYLHEDSRSIKAGDLATDADRAQFSQLQNYLSAHPGVNLDSHGGVTPGYSFDKDGAMKAVTTANEAKQADAARLAGPATEQPAAGGTTKSVNYTGNNGKPENFRDITRYVGDRFAPVDSYYSFGTGDAVRRKLGF